MTEWILIGIGVIEICLICLMYWILDRMFNILEILCKTFLDGDEWDKYVKIRDSIRR